MKIAIDLPQHSPWLDVTSDLEDPSAPLTLAKPDGVGALQLSVATYRGGASPLVRPEMLQAMLGEFASVNDLGEATDSVIEDGLPMVSAASFRADSFFRVWYLSDGANFALATYTCALENEPEKEAAECEAIVRLVRFS